jgi:hypothetical protein
MDLTTHGDDFERLCEQYNLDIKADVKEAAKCASYLFIIEMFSCINEGNSKASEMFEADAREQEFIDTFHTVETARLEQVRGFSEIHDTPGVLLQAMSTATTDTPVGLLTLTPSLILSVATLARNIQAASAVCKLWYKTLSWSGTVDFKLLQSWANLVPTVVSWKTIQTTPVQVMEWVERRPFTAEVKVSTATEEELALYGDRCGFGIGQTDCVLLSAIASRCNRLTSLYIGGAVHPFVMSKLGELRAIREVEFCYLSHPSVFSPSQCSAFRRAVCGWGQLRKIKLGRNYGSDNILADLGKYCPHLISFNAEWLSHGTSPITSDGVVCLADGCTMLESVGLSGSSVCDVGIQRLLDGCKHLTWLAFDRCNLISAPCINNLEKIMMAATLHKRAAELAL